MDWLHSMEMVGSVVIPIAVVCFLVWLVSLFF